MRKIIASKIVLAWILKYSAEEFRDCLIEQIVEAIEGEPELAAIPVYPGKRKSEAIAGMPNEDSIPNEGKVFYDVRFYAITPNGERIKLLVDVEAQKKFKPGYSLVTRGIFYCARMLSAQLGTEFIPDDYDDIKKVYSIWICMDVPEYAANTITIYSIEQKKIVGDFQGKERYDLLTVVMIGLGKDTTEKKGSELHGFLSALLSENLKPVEKEKRLQQDYGVDMENGMKEVLNSMCNLSDLIEERGIERGIEQGQLQMLKRLVNAGKLTVEEAAEEVQMTTDELKTELEKLN